MIMNEINKFDVIPNGLETYMVFTINKNLVFIDSMQFINTSLKKLVNNLSDGDFKYLSEELSAERLALVKQKGVYSYEYVDTFERFSETKIPDKR